MNVPSSQAVREDFDDQRTLVMPNRPSAHFASGVMSGAIPHGQAASGIMPVAQPYPDAHAQPEGYPFGYETPPSEVIPTADVLSSYPPATTEPTPLSVPPLGSLAPTSLSEPLATHRGSYVFQPSAPSDGRGRVAFIILLGFLIGIGGTYSYQVVKHSRPTSAEATAPEPANKPAEAKPPVATAAAPAVKPAPASLPEPKPELRAEAPKPAPADAKPAKTPASAKAAPKAVGSNATKSGEAQSGEPSSRPKTPRPKKARAEPNLEGRDLLNEGLD